MAGGPLSGAHHNLGNSSNPQAIDPLRRVFQRAAPYLQDIDFARL